MTASALEVQLEVADMRRATLFIHFRNRGERVEYVDRRMACDMGFVPNTVFETSRPRRFVGPRVASLDQDVERVFRRLGPGEGFSVWIELSRWFDNRGQPGVAVRYRASHRNPETGESIELLSQPVELNL